MKRLIAITLILALVMSVFPILPPKTHAGIPSEVVGIENDAGSAIFDNTVGIGSGQIADKGIEIAEEGLKAAEGSKWYTNIGRGSKLIKWGGFTIGTIDTIRDTISIFNDKSKHSTTIGKWTDKGLLIIGTGMGWAATIGTIMTIGATAPATGTVAVVTGTGFAVATAGVAIVRGVANTETVRNIEDLMAGKKKIVFAPFERPDIKEGRDIIKEELGFDPYDHSDNEIPDPATGIPVYKPNIYLYCENDMEAEVRIYPPQWITQSIPRYDEATGWKARIVNGSLNGTGDFLFYEAEVPEEGFQKETGWKIEAGKHETLLSGILDKYGFNKKEKEDFLDFWLGMLDEDTDYYAYPQGNTEVDAMMPLLLDPYPDHVFRLWFYFEPANGKEPPQTPGEPDRIQRNGFSVVEWGGMLKK